MKNFILLLFAAGSLFTATAQNGPVDFESGGFGADWTWTVFENDSNPALEIIANPDATGANTSATVAKFTALQTGQPFAGCETQHGADIGPYTIDATNSTIRIMVWKSVISDVGIKLVTESGWSKGELKVANTKVNEWEQLTFDFSTVDHESMTYDQIVVFPDFNARTMDNVIYFDNISFGGIPTSVTDFETKNIAMYPNPAQDNLTISGDQIIENIKVYSIVGELVMNVRAAENVSTLDISSLTKGMYVIAVTVDGETAVDQFIKN